MTMEETNALRIFERKIARKVYGPVQEEKHWRIRTNMEIKNISQGEDNVKFIKSLRLR
jgi:hypothetical protein